jgi:DMSO/TMAO reductase YedYZ heme-binding membrane subunit
MRQFVSKTTVALLVALASNGICMAQGEGGTGISFSVHSLIKPLGIATLCCMICTFIVGLFRRKLRTKFLKIHAPLAIISVILGLIHGTLVIVLYGM